MYTYRDEQPEAIRQVMLQCQKWLEESQNSCYGTRTFTLKAAQRGLGEYIIRSRSCECLFNEFLIDSFSISTWEMPGYGQECRSFHQRKEFLDIPTVIDLVNLYLYQTFYEWQGHSSIEIAHRGNGVNDIYSLLYQPSILHGKNLFRY